ncbi:MAG: hypothetical protein ABSF67_03060 [Roseiarcus sp.]|jgi:hypothetical protein
MSAGHKRRTSTAKWVELAMVPRESVPDVPSRPTYVALQHETQATTMRQTAADFRRLIIAPIATTRLDASQARHRRPRPAQASRGRRRPIAANFTHFSLTTAKDRNPAEGTPTDLNFAEIAAQ